MTGHINRSFIWIKVQGGDTDLHTATVQNKPEMPDVDGREDMVDAMVPDFYDKEITRLRCSFAGTPDTASALPVIRVAPDYIDSVPNNPAGANDNVTLGRLSDRSNFVRWVPDVNGDPGSEQFLLELDEPIHWPEQDLIHAAAAWDDTAHQGFTAHITLDWQRA